MPLRRRSPKRMRDPVVVATMRLACPPRARSGGQLSISWLLVRLVGDHPENEEAMKYMLLIPQGAAPTPPRRVGEPLGGREGGGLRRVQGSQRDARRQPGSPAAAPPETATTGLESSIASPSTTTATCTRRGASCCAASVAPRRPATPTAVRWRWSTTMPSGACSSGGWRSSPRAKWRCGPTLGRRGPAHAWRCSRSP